MNQDRDKINEDLITATGEKAGLLAKELHTLSNTIEELEESTLTAMLEIEALENARTALVHGNN